MQQLRVKLLLPLTAASALFALVFHAAFGAHIMTVTRGLRGQPYNFLGLFDQGPPPSNPFRTPAMIRVDRNSCWPRIDRLELVSTWPGGSPSISCKALNKKERSHPSLVEDNHCIPNMSYGSCILVQLEIAQHLERLQWCQLRV